MAINKNIPGSMIINHQSQGVTLQKRNKQKGAALRIPLPGFPKTFVFKDIKDIEHYFSGDLVQCLLCGRWFKSLARHLWYVHDYHTDDYKKRYGLPYNRGLISSYLHDNLKSIQKKLYSNGVTALSKSENRLKGFLAAQDCKRKKDQPFNTKRKKLTHKFSSSCVPKFTQKDVETVINRAKTGRTIKDVCNDHDTMSHTMFYKYKKALIE